MQQGGPVSTPSHQLKWETSPVRWARSCYSGADWRQVCLSVPSLCCLFVSHEANTAGPHFFCVLPCAHAVSTRCHSLRAELVLLMAEVLCNHSPWWLLREVRFECSVKVIHELWEATSLRWSWSFLVRSTLIVFLPFFVIIEGFDNFSRCALQSMQRVCHTDYSGQAEEWNPKDPKEKWLQGCKVWRSYQPLYLHQLLTAAQVPQQSTPWRLTLHVTQGVATTLPGCCSLVPLLHYTRRYAVSQSSRVSGCSYPWNTCIWSTRMSCQKWSLSLTQVPTESSRCW